MRKRKFYVIFVEHRTKIYISWYEYRREIHGFRRAVHKSYETLVEMKHAYSQHVTSDQSNQIESECSGRSINSIEII